MEKTRIDRSTLLFSGMYMAFCILGMNHTMRQKGMTLSVPYYVMIGLVGWFTIYAFLLTMVKLLQHSKKVLHCCVLSPQKYIVLAFVIIWVSCFVIYLNMYPGTLSSWAFVYLLAIKLQLPKVVIKMLVDTALFFTSTPNNK